jgi:hypothetical protein
MFEGEPLLLSERVEGLEVWIGYKTGSLHTFIRLHGRDRQINIQADDRKI